MALSAKALARNLGIRALLLKERVTTGYAWNPLRGGGRSAGGVPYARLNELRERDPVHRSELLRGWLLTRHADINEFLRDPQLSKDPANARRRGPLTQRQPDGGFDDTPSILGLDPPDHTRLRSLVSRAFTPRAIEQLRPRIEQIVAELLDAAGDAEEIDLIEALAYPLPVIVIAEMLGVPPEDRNRFKAWSNEVARGLDLDPTGERQRRAVAASDQLTHYFRGIIEQRRAEPREDLISALIAVEAEGDRLTEDELHSTLRLLLVAGNETTTNLIGNGMLALMQHPDQLRRLRDDRSLMPAAIDEMLRFDPPVQAVQRIAMRDFELDGRTIRSGDTVVCLFGPANRDPAAFPDPDRFDIGRPQTSNLSFGLGIHYCLGAPLARVEAPIAIDALLDRYEAIELVRTGRQDWRDTRALRGMNTLPVRVRTARTA